MDYKGFDIIDARYNHEDYAYGIYQPVTECYDRIHESEKLDIDERLVGQQSSYICVADSAKGSAHK